MGLIAAPPELEISTAPEVLGVDLSPAMGCLAYALRCSRFRTVRDLDTAWEPFWGAIRRRVVRSLEESGRSLAQVNGTLEACISPIDKMLSMRLLRPV